MIVKHSILVTGAHGQLGRSLQKIAVNYSNYQFTFVPRNILDLSQPASIKAYFRQHQFTYIINCAAYTAVDKAEKEIELAKVINHDAVKQLAEMAKKQNAIFIHISTDYVFDGRQYRPYVEADKLNPQSVYGASKLKGEQAILAVAPQGCIIRTSWVYSEFGRNFLKTMLMLGKQGKPLAIIFDQVGTPTYATDLALAIMQVITENNATQLLEHDLKIYHFSNEGICSWYDFTTAIFSMAEINCSVSPIETKDYPTPAKRPFYSVLNKAKIKHDCALTIPYWRDSVQACLNILAKEK
jgi:dTDP-4-dehydrorhamnose reductase